MGWLQFAGATDADDQLDSFDADVGLRGAVTLELAAETAGDVGGTLEVLTLPLAEIKIGPVIVTPYLGVDVRFDNSLDDLWIVRTNVDGMAHTSTSTAALTRSTGPFSGTRPRATCSSNWPRRTCRRR